MGRFGRIALVLGSTLLGLLVPTTASAGSGCHEAPTEGTGDTVVIADLCFGPSLLHADPGQEITFLNKDPVAHNVSGTGWGNYEDMFEGDRFVQSFADEGVYPFACTLHPGMNGAILVGETAVAAPAEIAPAVPSAPTPVDEDEGIGWIAPGAIGFVVGGAIAASVRRRRIATPVPA